MPADQLQQQLLIQHQISFLQYECLLFLFIYIIKTTIFILLIFYFIWFFRYSLFNELNRQYLDGYYFQSHYH